MRRIGAPAPVTLAIAIQFEVADGRIDGLVEVMLDSLRLPRLAWGEASQLGGPSDNGVARPVTQTRSSTAKAPAEHWRAREDSNHRRELAP